jgi:hypothetical protein
MQESRNSGIANIIRLILIAEILIIVGWAAHSVISVIRQSAMQAQ